MVLSAGCDGGADNPEPEDPAGLPDPLAGVISIEANSRVDQDTMDQLVLDEASPSTRVQDLPGSFILAGYLSGSNGFYSRQEPVFEFLADNTDVFRVSLAPGDRISLQRFGSAAIVPDIRAELFDQNEVFLTAASTGNTGSLSIGPPAGTDEQFFFLRLSALGSGPARYVMTRVGVSGAESHSFAWPEYRFVEGEAIVSLADGSGARAMGLVQISGSPERSLGGNDWLVSMNTSFRAATVQSKNPTLDWIRELRQTPGVASATPNYLVHALQQAPLPVEEPLYSRQWHYDLINTPTAWQIAPGGGAGVVVAVLDSGILRDSGDSGDWHPDLEVNSGLWSGEVVDFVSEAFDNDSQPGRDTNPADPGSSFGSSVFHGTHVAGTVAAVVNGLGGAGVAHGASLLPVRVLGIDKETRQEGTGSLADLLAALRWLAGDDNQPPRAHIVNLSLGGLPPDSRLQAAINAGAEKGILYVAAAGNSSTSAVTYPAGADNVFSVSAVDGAGQLAGYSNFGSWVDLAAPGGDQRRDANNDGEPDAVWSASGESDSQGSLPTFRGLQGTSMAAPHVSGVLALMKAENPDLDYDTVRGWLENGDLTNSNGEKSLALGWGLIDAAKAVTTASSGLPSTFLSASPALVSLDSDGAASVQVTLSVSGPGLPENIEIASEPAWVSSELTGSSAGVRWLLGVQLLPERLPRDRLARGEIVLAYQVGGARKELAIPTVAGAASDQAARNAGRHFVLLVETEPDESGQYNAVSQVAAEPMGGVYRFGFEADDGVEPRRMDEVGPGSYYLVAGTDLDGDGLICQSGEACAEYPVTGLREVIRIREGEALSDIAMTTSFGRPVGLASSTALPRPGFKGYRLMSADAQPKTDNAGAKAFK